MITQEIERDILQQHELAEPISSLTCREIIEMGHDEEMLIDDCSGGYLDLSQRLAELTMVAPNVRVIPLSDLNRELCELIQEADLDPEQTVYILPGGGGQRLATSLEEGGLYMPYQLRITVERPTDENGKKGTACVSSDSISLFASVDLTGKNIVVLDDAINAGGTLIAIREAISASTGGALQNRILAAAPIRFSVPDQNEGEIEYGVPGFDAVYASKVIVGPEKDRSSPVTFLSSFIKNGKVPGKDPRIQRLAAKSGTDRLNIAKCFTDMQAEYRTYLLKEKGYIPTNPDTVSLAEMLGSIQDRDAMLNFMRALCTASEIEDMTRRFRIAELLHQGYPVRDIVQIMGVSAETVVRVKFWFDEHPKGYQAAFNSMNRDQASVEDYVI